MIKITTAQRLKEAMEKKGLRQVDVIERAKPYFEKYNSKNRLEELWSPGIYYFSSVNLLLESSEKLLNSKVSDECLNGEFYCSLLYRYIKGFAFNFVDKFYQLGTPEDLEHVKKCLNFSLNNNCTAKNSTV